MLARLALLALLAPLAHSAASTSFRVLPLGDSITKGCGTDASPANNWNAVCSSPDTGGFRAPLWASLTAAGYNATFVGTQEDGPSWLPRSGAAHEGHPGWTTSQIHNIMPNWAPTNPDFILIHLGTNDLGQNHTVAQMVADMESLLSATKAALPKAKILLATIINMVTQARPDYQATVIAYNKALVQVAAEAGVVLVDMYTASGLCNGDTGTLARLCAECNSGNPCPKGYDRVHPTAAGYAIMGGVWAAALEGVLSA
jgi:lysophospholipase L1-like esterase